MKCAHLCIHCVQMTLPKCSRTIQFAKILCTSAISHVLKVNDNVPLQICSSHSLGLQPRQNNQLSLLSVLLIQSLKKIDSHITLIHFLGHFHFYQAISTYFPGNGHYWLSIKFWLILLIKHPRSLKDLSKYSI